MVRAPVIFFVFLVVIGGLLVLLRRSKVPPFILLLLASCGAGLAMGMDPLQVSRVMAKGFACTVEKTGIMLVAGGIIGIALERSGAACVLAEALVNTGGARRPVLALSILGYLAAIPVFCDAAFILFIPLAKILAKRTGVSLPTLTAALSAGLFAAYVVVPPTPGPLAAAKILGADLGIVVAGGLLAALVAAAAGCCVIRWAGRTVPAAAPVSFEKLTVAYPKLPGIPAAIMPLLVPLLLIALKTTANCPGAPLGQGILKLWIDFAGEPMAALLLGVGACLGLARVAGEHLSDWVNTGVKEAAPLVLVTAAGGALGGIFAAVGVVNYLGISLVSCQAGILLPFGLAAILKTVQGSSLAALVTAAAVVFPALPALGLAGPAGAALATLAIGAGAMMVSHVNDPYFWVVTGFSGLDAHQVLKSYSMATFVMGLAAMTAVLGLTAFLL